MEDYSADAQGQMTWTVGFMMKRVLIRMIKWTAALVLLGALLAVAFFLRQQFRGAEGTGESPQAPRRVQNNVVKLGAQLAESYGIKAAPAESAQWHQRITVYGQVVPNPRATTEIRAPFASTLRADPKVAWPGPGSKVKAGQVLAWLDIRVGPEARLDLATRLAEAHAKLQGAKELVKIQQERVDRFATVAKSITQADLDAARVQLTEAKTQMAAAKATAQQWEEALAEIDKQGEGKSATWSQPLKAPISGEITELAAALGMAVEPGALIARLVDFRWALVRIDLPLSSIANDPPKQLELSVAPASPPALAGASNRPEASKPAPPTHAVLVGAVPQVETASQMPGFWYEVDTTQAPPLEPGAAKGTGPGVWRPGLFVTADVKLLAAKPLPAVAVPETALLYHQGRALVYVQLSPGRFERREVQVFGWEGDRWLLASGVKAGEQVVYQRAQILLSEEFRSEADND
jgi:multidrug efflux pump subunit AcrA (membrane-fusion protein)